MGKNRHLKRPLSWFLARFGSGDARAAEALRRALSEPKPRRLSPAVIEDAEELLWTCR